MTAEICSAGKTSFFQKRFQKNLQCLRLQPSSVIFWTRHEMDAVVNSVNEVGVAPGAMHRAETLLADFFQQLSVVLTRPLILERLLTLMEFIAETVLFVSHDDFAPFDARLLHILD